MRLSSRVVVCLILLASLALVPMSGAAKRGSYKGALYGFNSRQLETGTRVTFGVRNGNVRNFVYSDPSYYCAGTGVYERAYFKIPSASIRNNRINKVHKSGGVTITLKGTFVGRRGSGTLVQTGAALGCSKNWRWKARLVP